MDPLRELNCLIGQLFLACTTTIVLIVQIYFALLYNSTYHPYIKRKLFEWIGVYKQQRKQTHSRTIEYIERTRSCQPTNQPTYQLFHYFRKRPCMLWHFYPPSQERTFKIYCFLYWVQIRFFPFNKSTWSITYVNKSKPTTFFFKFCYEWSITMGI